MTLKKISSEDLCGELNYRYGRIDQKPVPRLADFGTEKIVAELIDRSSFESGIETTSIASDAVCLVELSQGGVQYDKTLRGPALVLTIKT